MVNYTCASKIALISNKALLKPTKIRHRWTPQVIRSMRIFLFGVCRANDTKVTSAYLRCIRNETFIVISLLKKTFFLVRPIDIETKLFLDRSGRQW